MTQSRTMERRTFLAGALAATAATVLPLGALSGCAEGEPSKAAATQTQQTSLTEEERASAISDPSYMGGSTNFCGQDVTIGTGKYGQKANQVMIDQHAKYEPHLEKVTDRIYTAIGNSLSNSTIVIGDTGMIVIDTGENQETAELDLELFRTVTNLPASAVIYSHNHYANGTTAYVPADNPDNVPIVAQELFMQGLLSPLTETATSYVDRAHTMLGSYLPLEGEDGSVGGGLGAYYNNPFVESHTPGLIPPNTLIPANEHMVEMKIDGLTFQFFPTASDSVDNINIYIVEENTIVTNQAWGVLYNMYTLRGEAYRDPVKMLEAIDTLIALEADNVVSVHALPLLGRESVSKELVLQRDCMQFVYDQTIRYMNKGYDPDQIVAAVKIPAYMVEGAITLPVYGEIEHFVRGVYRGLVGWFANDPIELHPVAKSFESAYFVQLAGGADKLVEEANRVLEDNQFAWAATLATHVLNAEPEHAGAKAAKAQACRKMAQITEATNTRHWYMTKAWELEGKLDKSVAPAAVTKDKLAAAPRTLVLDMLRVSIVPEKALDMNESLVITYSDESTSNSMTIRNCIGQVTEGRVENPSVEIVLPYDLMLDIVLKAKSFDECLQNGDIAIEGDPAKLETIMSVCEMQL